MGMIAGRMKLKEKTDNLDAFTDALGPNGKRKSKRDIKILIGTTRLVGVGLQLTRASNVVLMEPDNEFFRERQGYARVHRIGQRNPLSRSYRLIMAESEIEQRIVKRQNDRREFFGKRLTADASAELDRADKLREEVAIVKELQEEEAYKAEHNREAEENLKTVLTKKGRGKGKDGDGAGPSTPPPSRGRAVVTGLKKQGM